MKREGLVSIGAAVLAFLATQHHNLHMLLLALGLGGAGVAFVQAYPGIRRGMLLLSLVMVVASVSTLRRTQMPSAARVLVSLFTALALGLVVWSLVQFGL